MPRRPARAARARRRLAAGGDEARVDHFGEIEAAGARLLYFPSYSPDFNPIENAFAKLKALLRKAAARTHDALWDTIGSLLDTFTEAECQNYPAHCPYEFT